jgi:murein DD-endopeptidase MepM/ murein hydrolase activator NlpD
MFKHILLVISLTLLMFPLRTVQAQNGSDNPTYIVQPGDTLNHIAAEFGVPLRDIIQINNITDPNNLSVGDSLIIPGLQGVQGVLTVSAVPLGYDLGSLAVGFQIPQAQLARINRVTSPSEIFAGANLILPKTSQDSQLNQIGQLASGESLLEASIVSHLNPWSLAIINNSASPSDFIAGSTLFYNTGKDQSVSVNNSLITKIESPSLPLHQGDTFLLRVYTNGAVNLSGKLGDQKLVFHLEKTNQYIALQGIYAMATPGLVSLQVSAGSESGAAFNSEESLLIKSANFPQDPPLEVDPKTLDPAVTGPEDKQIADATAPSTPDKLWTKIFRAPVDSPCIKSYYGDRRSYNGGPYNMFHTGVDFGVCANNLNIYAPAPGKVVYVGLQTVRGNVTIIDHGWGVYSGFYHQSKTLVKVGDTVVAGQIIGEIGATGRVTGPHLHWDLFVGGIQVNGLDWLDQVYP